MAGKPGRFANRRRLPGQHDLAADGHRDGFGAEIARDGECPAPQHDPALVLVEVHAQVVQPRVGEVGLVVPQRDQRRGRRRAAARARAASTSSHTSFDRSKVCGSCGSGTSSASHPCSANSALRPSAVARARSGSGWLLKNWNGLDDAPLLAHEEHCGVRRSERQRGLDRELAEVQVLRRPVADRAVAHLVVGQGVGQQPGRRDGRGVQGRAVPPAPERGVGARVEVAVFAAWSPGPPGCRSPSSSPAVRRTRRCGWRGGCRRPTARSCRSPPRSRGVISRGSLRSLSAISDSGRPNCSASASVSADSSSRMWTAVVSTSACTASRRSPSAWKSRIHRSAHSMM